MRIKTSIALGVLSCCAIIFVWPQSSNAQTNSEAKPQKEQFAANAFLPHGAGRRMVAPGTLMPVNIYVDGYSSDAEIQQLQGALVDGGPDALHKMLEDMKPKGKITLVGRVGFYDLKAIRSRPTETGRRLIAVTDRPIGFLEAYYANPSQDYKIGILILDLKKNEKGKERGEGQLIYAARVKLKDNVVEVEHYAISPVILRNVHKW